MKMTGRNGTTYKRKPTWPRNLREVKLPRRSSIDLSMTRRVRKSLMSETYTYLINYLFVYSLKYYNRLVIY